MPDSSSQTAQVPPEVARYLKGAPPESQQFDFLIGDWQVSATRYQEDGTPLFQYQASWTARHLNDGRMVLDDFKALAPTGQAVSSFVTLRTYCEVTQRWEMAGLAALQPAAAMQWHGEFQHGEMRMDAQGTDTAGDPVHTRIRFFEIEKNSFRWESQASRDECKTWGKTASLVATRVAA